MALYNPLLIKKLEDHLKKNPASKSFCPLAQIYLSNGEVSKAEEICQKGLDKNPSYSPAYVLMAEICRNRGQMEKALECLKKAQEKNPDNPHIYKNLAEIYKKKGDITKTLSAYKMLSILEPEDPVARENVQHLEKVAGRSLAEEISSSSMPEPSLDNLSANKRKKLIQLNKILARVERIIDQKPKA